MDVLVLAVAMVANIFCFLIGAKVGQAVAKGEKVELPKVNPMEAIREYQNKREAEREQDRMSVVLGNIDAYDGTSNGQRDVPKG